MEVRYPPSKGVPSAILARYPMKTRLMGAMPPLRYYLERVLRNMGGVSRTGLLSIQQDTKEYLNQRGTKIGVFGR